MKGSHRAPLTPLRSKDEILSLEVTVGDIEAVHVIDRDGDLREDREGIILLKWTFGEELLKELAPSEDLHDDIHAFGVADDLDQVDDVSGCAENRCVKRNEG